MIQRIKPDIAKLSIRGKRAGILSVLLLAIIIAACSVNPATGERQFTALLPPEQEAAVGAQEHTKVRAAFGEFVDGPVANYVNQVGQRVAEKTERSDVEYKFYVIDSPVVNAFAVPGGYIYVSRGLLALANNEAELAAVLAHEIGHITGRHSAERVSQGFLVGLGAAVLSAAANDPGVSQAAGLGSDLYIKSYSRGQEHQADELGVRYLSRAGYDPMAMASFLNSLDQSTKLEEQITGKSGPSFVYFSTHPQTEDRVGEARAEAQKYPNAQDYAGRDVYLNQINGLVYGDSAAQGFVRGNAFYHTQIGFMFEFPQGFNIANMANEVSATHPNGSVVIFDMDKASENMGPMTYLRQQWLKGETVSNPETMDVNGMPAATASFAGTVKGQPVTIRVVAIEWQPGQYFRFQMAIPRNVNAAFVDDLKRMTYSFRRLSDEEKRSIEPKKIQIVQAGASDSVSSLASRMAFPDYQEERFRVLNDLPRGQNVAAGQKYKIVVQ